MGRDTATRRDPTGRSRASAPRGRVRDDRRVPMSHPSYAGEPPSPILAGMRKRRLGTTGYDVTEVGFGGWGLGADMWLGASDEECLSALAEALHQGVNFIDTALAYGEGHSERLIARVLKETGRREQVVVSTKIPPKNYEWPGRAAASLEETFPPEHVVRCVETSLCNLGLDALALEQLHVWHDTWLDGLAWERTHQAMSELKQDGKVLHWGISINDHAPETALRVLRDPLFETAQVIYNIYDRSAEEELFGLAGSKPLGVIVRVPFDEGGLTGAVGAETTFPAGDWREQYFRGDRRAEAGRRAEALRGLLGEEAATLPELALRFCLSRSEVTTVIPGMRRPEHARANAAVADGPTLTARMLAALKGHAWEKNWYRD